MDVVNIIVGLGLLYGIHSMTKKNKKLRNKTIKSIKPTNSKSINKPNSNNTTRKSINKPNSNNTTRKSISKPTNSKPTNSNQELTNIKMLFWNVFYESFTKKELEKKGHEIIQFINDYEPNIMVLTEASQLVPRDSIGVEKWFKQIKLKDYNKNIQHFSTRNNDGILIYWNDEFEFIKRTRGFNIENDKISHDKTTRPCLGVKLRHNNVFINVIGLHLGHHLSKEIVLEGIQQIAKELNIKKDEQVILGGDMNEFYKYNLDHIELEHCKLELKSKTSHGKLLTTRKKEPLDMIYSNISTLEVSLNEEYMSDHLPLLVNFESNYIKQDTLLQYDNKWKLSTLIQEKAFKELKKANAQMEYQASKKQYNITINNDTMNIKLENNNIYMKRQSEKTFKLVKLLSEAITEKNTKQWVYKVDEENYILGKGKKPNNPNVFGLN
jgi:endonuclease/exonuclease/phosphatase family metal-dependent hydrolase